MSSQPLVSFCICFYNQAEFVEDTIKGALSQDYENMEVVLSDDCSQDGTFEIIKEVVGNYKGPHKIILNRNDKNIGLVPHVNKVLYELAKGEYFFLNGGDDVSLPDRVSVGMSYFLDNPKISAFTCSHIVINKYGEEIEVKRLKNDSILSLDDYSYLSSPSFMTGGVALSLRREVLTKFGPMENDCQTEDSVLRFRAILTGLTMRSSYVGFKYRKHDNNISNHIFRLKTEPIARQYKRDLDKVKEELDHSLYDLINAKIEYYIKYRNLQSIESSAGLWSRLCIRYKKNRLVSSFKKVVLKRM